MSFGFAREDVCPEPHATRVLIAGRLIMRLVFGTGSGRPGHCGTRWFGGLSDMVCGVAQVTCCNEGPDALRAVAGAEGVPENGVW